jgi:hypothetical protein
MRAPKLTTPNPDEYLIRNTEEGNYDTEVHDENLKEQMMSIRKVIEMNECSDGSSIINEILADFLQDKSKSWYFINLVNYKTEFLIAKKKKTPIKRVRRSVKSLAIRNKISYEITNKNRLEKTFSTKEMLRQEAIKALEQPRDLLLHTSEQMYRRAYHLKAK